MQPELEIPEPAPTDAQPRIEEFEVEEDQPSSLEEAKQQW